MASATSTVGVVTGAFRLPPYFTLILRAFGTLEGWDRKFQGIDD